MTVPVSDRQLETAGIRLGNRAGGFFMLKVLEKKDDGQYRILLSGRPVDVFSKSELVPGTSYRAQWTQKQGGGIKLQNLCAVKDFDSISKAFFQVLNPSVKIDLSTFSLFPSLPIKSLFYSLLLQRGVLLSEKMQKRILDFLKKGESERIHYESDSSSKMMKSAISISLASKGILPDEKLVYLLQSMLFGWDSSLEKNPVFLPLFNGAKDENGLRWSLFPFSMGDDKFSFKGSVSIGRDEEKANPMQLPQIVNINWNQNHYPHSIQLRPFTKSFFCCGLSFKEGKKGFTDKIVEVLNQVGYKNKNAIVDDGFFDGFYVYNVSKKIKNNAELKSNGLIFEEDR